MSLLTTSRRGGRVRPALLGVASMALVLTACGGSTDSDSPDSGDAVTDASITFASSAIATTLDPAATPTSVGRTYSKQVFDQLVTFDGDGVLRAGLATEWERINDTAMKFTLRDDVTYSSGAELGAEDVVENINRVLSGAPEYAVVAGRLGTLKNAKALSET